MPQRERQNIQGDPSPDPGSGITSFDELAKGLATGAVSRRKALRWMGGTLVGAVLASVPGVAQAQREDDDGPSACARFCTGLFPPGLERAQCLQQGAQGGGPCYECTPGVGIGPHWEGFQCGCNEQFNFETCECECPSVYQTCGGRCIFCSPRFPNLNPTTCECEPAGPEVCDPPCPSGQTCVNGVCLLGIPPNQETNCGTGCGECEPGQTCCNGQLCCPDTGGSSGGCCTLEVGNQFNTIGCCPRFTICSQRGVGLCEPTFEACNEPFVCGGQIVSCGQGTSTYDGLCLCNASTDGPFPLCVNNFLCKDAPTCQSNAECVQQFGPNFVCGDSCCGRTCMPNCGTDFPGAVAEGGMSAAGPI
jgi:hypothetical protein